MARYDDIIIQKIAGMSKAYKELSSIMTAKDRVILAPSFNAVKPLSQAKQQYSEIDKALSPQDAFKARKELIEQYYIPTRKAFIDAVNIINNVALNQSQYDGLGYVNGLMTSDIEIGNSLPPELQATLQKAINRQPDRKGKGKQWSRKVIPELAIHSKKDKPEPTRTSKRKKSKASNEYTSPNKPPAKKDTSNEQRTERNYSSATMDAPFTKTAETPSTPPPETPKAEPEQPKKRQKTASEAGPETPRDAGTSGTGAGAASTPGGAAIKRMLDGIEDRLSKKIDKLENTVKKGMRIGAKKLSGLKRGLDPNKLSRNTGDLSDSAKLDRILNNSDMLEREFVRYTKKTTVKPAGKEEEDPTTPAGKRRLKKQNQIGFWKTIKSQLAHDIGGLGKDIHNTLFPYLKMKDSNGMYGFGQKGSEEDKKDKKLIRETIQEWTRETTRKYGGDGGGQGKSKKRGSNKAGAEFEDMGQEDWRAQQRKKKRPHKAEVLDQAHSKVVGSPGRAMPRFERQSPDQAKLLANQGLEEHQKMLTSDAQKAEKKEIDKILEDVEKKQDKTGGILNNIWNLIKGAAKWFSELKFVRVIWNAVKGLGKVLRILSGPFIKLGGRLVTGLSEALGAFEGASLVAGGVGAAVGGAVDLGMAAMMEKSFSDQAKKNQEDFNKKFKDHMSMIGKDQYKILDDDQYKNQTFKFADLPQQYRDAIQHNNYLPTKEEKNKLQASNSGMFNVDEQEKLARKEEYGIGGTDYGDDTSKPAVRALPSNIPAALRQVSKEHFDLTDTSTAAQGGSTVMQPIILPTQTSGQGSGPDISLGLPINTTATGKTISEQMGFYKFRTPAGANFR